MSNSCYLRRAEVKDAKFIYTLRTNKMIRRNFFNSSTFPYDKHLNWLREKLSSSDAHIFIIKNECNRRIGYVRFEKEKDSIWKISIAITPKSQGKGYGCRAIMMGCRRLYKIADVKRIAAYMWKDNLTSLNAFKKVGFVLKKNMEFYGKEVALLELENNVR